jgi:hypothetical protein
MSVAVASIVLTNRFTGASWKFNKEGSSTMESIENLFKTSPVKKISHLRSQDKKAPKLSHLIEITGYPFNTSPRTELSRLGSNKFHDETIFFTH